MSEIFAAGAVVAPAASVFDHLADLRTHWELTGGRVRLLDPDSAAQRGGRVRMRGPLGLGRDATTEVLRAERPKLLEGRACVGGATEALIRWRLDAVSEAETRVELTAEVVSAGRLDRVVLGAGGRFWLTRLFRGVMRRLEEIGPALEESAMGVAAPAVAVEASR